MTSILWRDKTINPSIQIISLEIHWWVISNKKRLWVVKEPESSGKKLQLPIYILKFRLIPWNVTCKPHCNYVGSSPSCNLARIKQLPFQFNLKIIVFYTPANSCPQWILCKSWRLTFSVTLHIRCINAYHKNCSHNNWYKNCTIILLYC